MSISFNKINVSKPTFSGHTRFGNAPGTDQPKAAISARPDWKHNQHEFSPKAGDPGFFTRHIDKFGLFLLPAKIILLPAVGTLGAIGWSYTYFRNLRTRIVKENGVKVPHYYLNGLRMLPTMDHLKKGTKIRFDIDKKYFVQELEDHTTQEIAKVSPRPILKDIIRLSQRVKRPVDWMEKNRWISETTAKSWRNIVSRASRTVASQAFTDEWVNDFFRADHRKGFFRESWALTKFGFKMFKQVWFVVLPRAGKFLWFLRR